MLRDDAEDVGLLTVTAVCVLLLSSDITDADADADADPDPDPDLDLASFSIEGNCTSMARPSLEQSSSYEYAGNTNTLSHKSDSARMAFPSMSVSLCGGSLDFDSSVTLERAELKLSAASTFSISYLYTSSSSRSILYANEEHGERLERGLVRSVFV